MRRPRPYIPLDVRIKVAERQIQGAIAAGLVPSIWWPTYVSASPAMTARERLIALVDRLAEALGDVLELDHDPALILRRFRPHKGRPEASWFTPNANDPDFLVYRVAGEHQQKTTGRKAGATHTVTTKGSDIWLKSKFNRLEGKTKRRPKQKIAARRNPWQKGRKLPSRAPRSAR